MSVSNVATAAYAPAANYGLLATRGYGQAGTAPPPPPVVDDGPQRAGNRRWWAWHESPIAREARQKVLEKLKREELGIIAREPEIEEQIADSVASVLEALPQEPPVQGARANVSNAEISRIVREVFEEIRADIREDDDEEEFYYALLQ